MIRITHDVSEQALAVHHDAVLFFVLSLAEIRQLDADGLAALLDLHFDAIDSAGALFERARVAAACVVLADSPFATGCQPVVTRQVSWFEPASASLWVGLQTLALLWLNPQFQAGWPSAEWP